MLNRLTDVLALDRPAIACWMGLRDPQYITKIVGAGFDIGVLDMQHGLHDERSVIDGLAAIAHTGKSPFVRIPVGRWDMVERAMDFGALGVIAPMINNREDAKRFARSTKFPPVGSRSFGPRMAAEMYGVSVNDYVSGIGEHSLALAMVETREAYDNLDDIVSVEGIDGVLMGPSDFSISITGNSVPDPYGDATRDLVADIAKRVKAAGKIAFGFSYGPEHANLVHKLGYGIISTGLDDTYLAKGVEYHLDGLDFL